MLDVYSLYKKCDPYWSLIVKLTLEMSYKAIASGAGATATEWDLRSSLIKTNNTSGACVNFFFVLFLFCCYYIQMRKCVTDLKR